MTGTFRVPGYVVERLIGAGASGDVWQGRVAATGDPVALKRVLLDDPERIRGAHGEAAVLATLDHPNLMRIHEVVALRDAVVLVLDLAAGGSLADLIAARGRLAVGEVVAAVAGIGAALAHAHACGVVHGDVSAGNVLFTDIGLPLLADLGVARVLGDDETAHSTPAYIDPVVARGGLPGPWTDVFMLGGVALHALTGQPTWPGANVPEALTAAAQERLDLPTRLAVAGVPAEVGAVLATALVSDPLHRSTAADFALELRHAAQPCAIALTAGRPGASRSASGSPAAAPTEAGRAGRSARSPAITSDPDEHTVLWAARPEFARPVAAALSGGASADMGPGPGIGPGVEIGTPAGAAPALTHGVRARPVARRPPPRPWWRRRPTGVVGAATLVAVGVAVAVAVGSRPSPAGDVAAEPAAATGPAGVSSRASGGADDRAARSAGDGAAGAPGGGASGAASGRASGPASGGESAARRAVMALARLDGLRGQAFAQRRADLLGRVYASESLRVADAAVLSRLVPAGCGLDGVRTRYTDVEAVPAERGAVTVTATAVLAPSRLRCGGEQRASAPGAGPTRLRVRLVPGPDGALRIAAQTVA